MNGAARLQLGDLHDRQAVVPALEARGYVVQEFGQALLSPEVRSRLRQRTSLIRWLPDRAVTIPDDRERLALIDSKTCTAQNYSTPNHAIEFRSILGSQVTRMPTFYICSDLRVMDSKVLFTIIRLPDVHDDLWPCCRSCMAIFRGGANELDIADRLPEHCPAHSGGGSGTPFIRFPKSWCSQIDAVFPALAKAVLCDSEVGSG